MGKIENITIGLPTELLADVRKVVSAGEFKSQEELVLAAVKALLEGREAFGLTDADLGSLWDAGVASGPGQFASVDDLVAEAERRAAKQTS